VLADEYGREVTLRGACVSAGELAAYDVAKGLLREGLFGGRDGVPLHVAASLVTGCVAACVADSTISACNSRGASTALVPLNGRERAAHSAFSSSLLRIFSRCAAEPSQATSKLGIPVAVESTIDARKDGMLGLSSGTSAASAKVTTRFTIWTVALSG
jgi:hypothetical protein